MAAATVVLDAARPLLTRPVEVRTGEIGFAALDHHGTTIPDHVIDAARHADGVLLGPVSHNAYPPREAGGLNPSGVLRGALDLYANVRPARAWPGLPAPSITPIDLVVVRENLEGFYADRNMYLGPGEVMPVPGVAIAMRRITEHACHRIAAAAFELAATRPARKVTAIHKANVMRMSDGLFLDCVRAVAATYPGIAYDEVLVDAAAALLVRDAARFDVLVTTNMFGDILSDLASELSGRLGLAGSLNRGPSNVAAQAQHGSAPDIAGQGKANPVSMILSMEMMLRHLGEGAASDAIRSALERCLGRTETRTPDLGGPLSTSGFADTVAARIERNDPMTQTAIPFLMLRGGTSRGPYLHRADLPADRDALARVLVAMVGSGHPLNIDGIGGGNAVTTKVAMLSPGHGRVGPTSTTSSRRSASRTGRSTSTPPAATSSPASARRPSRWGWSRRGAETPGQHPRRQHRRAGRGHRAHHARGRRLRRHAADRRGAGHGGAGGLALHGHRRGGDGGDFCRPAT